MATFDELAQRLASGLPKERIAAAEALAELDDTRVAPTLAKALGDPSPEVRARAEELLGQFSRGGSQDNLRLLLDEARRVSLALANEVTRLRGGAEPASAPALAAPIEPPAGPSTNEETRNCGLSAVPVAVARGAAAASRQPSRQYSRNGRAMLLPPWLRAYAWSVDDTEQQCATSPDMSPARSGW